MKENIEIASIEAEVYWIEIECGSHSEAQHLLDLINENPAETGDGMVGPAIWARSNQPISQQTSIALRMRGDTEEYAYDETVRMLNAVKPGWDEPTEELEDFGLENSDNELGERKKSCRSSIFTYKPGHLSAVIKDLESGLSYQGNLPPAQTAEGALGENSTYGKLEKTVSSQDILRKKLRQKALKKITGEVKTLDEELVVKPGAGWVDLPQVKWSFTYDTDEERKAFLAAIDSSPHKHLVNRVIQKPGEMRVVLLLKVVDDGRHLPKIIRSWIKTASQTIGPVKERIISRGGGLDETRYYVKINYDTSQEVTKFKRILDQQDPGVGIFEYKDNPQNKTLEVWLYASGPDEAEWKLSAWGRQAGVSVRVL